jgi:(2R)-sulfolactate sulfo-lyase subunit alpha
MGRACSAEHVAGSLAISYIRKVGFRTAALVRGEARLGSKGDRRVPAPQFLVHSPKDNVGVVVVEGLKAGTDMLGVVTETDTTLKLTARQDIPIGHKVALKALKAGDTIIKYGEDIGRMVADAGMGDHVHVQNLKTKRW